MTVSSATTRNSYSGNGSTTAFAYAFKIFATSDLEVVIRLCAGERRNRDYPAQADADAGD